jgi:flavin reductase (NADH)
MKNNNLGASMKLGMRLLLSGVSILTARMDYSELFAMTVSSVTYVSDNPASLLVCINKQVSQQGFLSTLGNRFVINVLSPNHEVL